VSQEIRQVAVPVYFKINAFIMHVRLADFEQAASWLDKVASHCGKRPFRRFRFQMRYCRWSELPKAKPLTLLLAAGTLELDLGGIDITAPVRMRGSAQSGKLIMMNDLQGGRYIQRALEEALLLGQTAREQNWSARKVSRQFEGLMALKLPLEGLEAYKPAKKTREEQSEKRERRRQGRGSKKQ
jgi:hypothetical protein